MDGSDLISGVVRRRRRPPAPTRSVPSSLLALDLQPDPACAHEEDATRQTDIRRGEAGHAKSAPSSTCTPGEEKRSVSLVHAAAAVSLFSSFLVCLSASQCLPVRRPKVYLDNQWWRGGGGGEKRDVDV